MNKLKQIEALVEEAIEKLRMVGGINPDQRPYCMKILTDLAKKSAEIGDVDQPALQPLPEEIPKLLLNDLDPYRFWHESENCFNYHFSDIKKLYNLFRKHFGTPSNNLQPLPEKMPEWFMDQFLQQSALENWNKVRQHFGTQPREWWMDLKKGDKFIYDYTPFNYKEIREFSELLYVEESKNYLIIDSKDVFFRIQFCSPCTDPEAEFIATLTLEQLAMYKHVKEGKG